MSDVPPHVEVIGEGVDDNDAHPSCPTSDVPLHVMSEVPTDVKVIGEGVDDNDAHPS